MTFLKRCDNGLYRRWIRTRCVLRNWQQETNRISVESDWEFDLDIRGY